MKKGIVVGLILGLGTFIWSWLTPPLPELTVQQIADNYGYVYSIYHDRADITNGTYEVYPAEGDKFRIVSAAEFIVEIEVDKSFNAYGSTLEVAASYELRMKDFLGTAATTDILVDWYGEVIVVLERASNFNPGQNRDIYTRYICIK